MRKLLLFRWNYPLRWHVRRVGLGEPYRDDTPNMTLMILEVIRIAQCRLSETYEFVKRVK